MTERDGLTAEQEAKRRWPTAAPWTPTPAQGQNAMHFAFVAGAEWATKREQARVEAAEARIAELESALEAILWHVKDTTPIGRIARGALTAPTTEAVTEVEGS